MQDSSEPQYESAFGKVIPKDNPRLPPTDLGTLSSDLYVDGYVSTDGIDEILELHGFRCSVRNDGQYALQNHNGCWINSLVHQKSGILVDYHYLDIDEAQTLREKIGFVPMAKFRVHTGGNPSGEKVLLQILEAFDVVRQNVAYVNDIQTVAFVHHSDYY